MKEELKRLPTKHYEVYSTAVKRIREQSQDLKDLGLRILAWVIYASRLLTVVELQHAIATRSTDQRFNEDGILSAEEFLARTAGLLTVQNDKIQCVHYTVEEFLREPRQEQEYFSGAREHIALTCLTYLRFEDFRDPCDQIQKRCSNYPFLKYAAFTWGYHFTKAQEQKPELLQATRNIISQDMIPLGSLQVIATKTLQNPVAIRIPTWKKNLTELQMAIIYGLDGVVEAILSSEKVDKEELGYKDETALHTAARSSATRAMGSLLKHKANVNATNYSGKTALDMIMIAPWQRITWRVQEPAVFHMLFISILHRLFNDITKPGSREPSEIDKQIKMEEADIRKAFGVFLNHQSDPRSEALMTKLILARGYRMNISELDEQIVYMLLDAGIDINSQSSPDATALQLASTYGRRNLAQVLLEKGANPFLRRTLGFSALELAKHCGYVEIAELISQKTEHIQKLEDECADDTAKLGEYGKICVEDVADRE